MMGTGDFSNETESLRLRRRRLIEDIGLALTELEEVENAMAEKWRRCVERRNGVGGGDSSSSAESTTASALSEHVGAVSVQGSIVPGVLSQHQQHMGLLSPVLAELSWTHPTKSQHSNQAPTNNSTGLRLRLERLLSVGSQLAELQEQSEKEESNNVRVSCSPRPNFLPPEESLVEENISDFPNRTIEDVQRDPPASPCNTVKLPIEEEGGDHVLVEGLEDARWGNTQQVRTGGWFS